MSHAPRTPLMGLLAAALALAGLACTTTAAGDRPPAPAGGPEEELWSRRNLASALYEEEEFARAVPLFRELVGRDGSDWTDAVNLGSALRAADSLDAAEQAFEAALSLSPDAVEALFGLGLVAKRRNDNETAAARFARVTELVPRSPEALYQLGVVLQRQNDLAGATAAFTRVVELGFDKGGLHYVSGLYRQAQLLFRQGDREAGQAGIERYRSFVDRGLGKGISDRDLETGPLTDPLLPLDATRRAGAGSTPPVFRTADAPWELPGGFAERVRWVRAADLTGDGREDLLLGDGSRLVLLARTEGGWEDRTAAAGLGAAGLGAGCPGAVAADLDEDGARDLLLLPHPEAGGSGGPVWLWADSAGVFHAGDSPVGEAAFRGRATPWDYDHDGDLDLVYWGRAMQMWRNQGERRFEIVGDVEAFGALEGGVAAIPLDYDDDRDSDLFWARRDGGASLLSSLREGRFVEESDRRGLTTALRARAAVVRDFDGDGDDDLGLLHAAGFTFFDNVAAAEAGAPPTFVRRDWPGAPATAGDGLVLSEDWNLDGYPDLLLATGAGPKGGLTLGLGTGGFTPRGAPEALADPGAAVTAMETFDADGDGDLDLVCAGANGLVYVENAGEPKGAWIRVVLNGTKNNTDGIGAVVELRAGTLYRRRIADGPVIHFGLGSRPAVQTVRITWPNGILQNVTEPSSGLALSVEEKEGLVGSCPFLYAWNGEKTVFISDVLGITPLGLPMMPGMYVPPDCDEYVLVRGDELAPRDGKYVFQFTEELREVTYLDEARLEIVDHPAGTLVFPNERFTFPPFPEKRLYVAGNTRPPARVTDPAGADVTDRIARLDGRSPDAFALTKYQGITEPTYLEIDVGPTGGAERVMLFLTGWLYWTNASINVGLAHDPTHHFVPPYLEVADGAGGWERVPGFVGFPAGKTKTMPLDLTGLLNLEDPRVRLHTTLRLYWDRILVWTGDDADSRVTERPLESADLHFRGWSARVDDPDPTHAERFDYARVSREAPWPQHIGRYTRFGDVTELATVTDDRYVVMGTGDECTLVFDAAGVPDVPDGWVRDYVLYLNGWAKDGDPNTVTPTTVAPLPFHAMSGYPYGPDEAYPATDEHRAYRETWNTRREVNRVRDLRPAGDS